MSTWLIDTALYTGLLIALVLVLRRPVAKHFGSTIAYALWALPLLRFFLPPLVLPASFAPPPEAAPAAIDPAVLALLLAAEETSATVAPSWQWVDLVLPLWLGSAALFLAWRMSNYLTMRSMLLAEAKPVGEAGKVRLVETPAVASPIAFGVFDKVVALPPRFMAMEDRHARDLAIAHELAHHAGHDIAANFAAQPLLALHWFNPLAWAGWRAMRRDQEAACDARVLAGRDRRERVAYANVIAGFAAGPRLELAAPMACPMIGEKSIIHRLRSLSMTDISRRRRMTGRLLLGAAVLAVPLTASVSYAQADAPAVEAIELAPSTAASPAAPTAPGAPVPPDAPTPSEAKSPEVRTFVLRRTDGAATPEGERRVYRLRHGQPLSEEELKELSELGKRFEGEDWEVFVRRQEEFAQRFAEQFGRHGEQMAERGARMAALAPLVEERCDGSGAATSSFTDQDGRRRIVICQRAIERQAHAGAVTGLRSAREAIARNSAIDAATRDEILKDLDGEIRRLERENRGS